MLGVPEEPEHNTPEAFSWECEEGLRRTFSPGFVEDTFAGARLRFCRRPSFVNPPLEHVQASMQKSNMKKNKNEKSFSMGRTLPEASKTPLLWLTQENPFTCAQLTNTHN